MTSKLSPDRLSRSQLEAALKQCVRLTKDRMAPLLYYLREKEKKQGSRAGGGFGAWVEEHLPFTRRTADNWANEYGISKGLMKPPRKLTSRKSSKGSEYDDIGRGKPHPDGVVKVQFVLRTEERRDFEKAKATLDKRGVLARVIYDAVLSAAANGKKPNGIATENQITTRAETRKAAAARA